MIKFNDLKHIMRASHYLHEASADLNIAHWLTVKDVDGERFFEDALERLRDGARELGFDLVEREERCAEEAERDG